MKSPLSRFTALAFLPYALLFLAVATLTRLPTAPFWQLARVGFVALPAAGLAIGAVALFAVAS